MKQKFSFICGLGFICLSACFASAQEGDRPKGPPQGGPGGGGDEAARRADFIKRADTDGDGKISKEEFIAMNRKENEDRFGKADANADGFIDQDEFSQITQRMREGGARRPGGEGGPGGPPGGGDGGVRRPPGSPEGGPRPEGGSRPEGSPPGAGGPGGQGSPGSRPGGMFGDPKEGFKRMDADSNGSVSEEEFIAAMTKMREMMSRGGGGPRPGGEGGASGGFRRPGSEGGAPGGGGEGGFRRPPVEGGDTPKEGPKDAPKDAPKPEGEKPKESA